MNEQTQNVTIECTTGDIIKQSDLDAIVNAANAEKASLPTLKHVQRIRFVLFGKDAKAGVQAALERAGLAVSSRSP